MNALQILKNSGNYEEFSIIKLKRSLLKSGLTEEKADDIARKLKQRCAQGVSSKKLYRMAYNLVKKESRIIASKYSMTRAISELGPDGYHFEKFVCALFEKQGYQASTNHFAQGRCVKHEIDVKAVNAKTLFCECKFHNNTNTKNDLKTTLYVRARYLDLLENPDIKLDEFWLISNTKFSKDAIQYAECTGLKLLGPNAPHQQALSELAVKYKVFPISSVTNLKKKQIKQLVKQGHIFAKDILRDPNILSQFDINQNTRDKVLSEIRKMGQK